jgi:hypothetical protein
MRNFLVDVAFSVEGPWEEFEDIPFKILLDGLEQRWRTIAETEDNEAFWGCDSCEVNTLKP